MEDKINKIQALATSDEKAKMIYMWVKSNVISLSEFKMILKLIK